VTRDDTIKLAMKAGLLDKVDCSDDYFIPGDAFVEEIEAFAELVAEAERERMIVEGWRHCAEGQRTTQYCGLLEDAVKAERKARKPTSAHDKVYSEVDLANAYQKGWDAAMLRRSLGGT